MICVFLRLFNSKTTRGKVKVTDHSVCFSTLAMVTNIYVQLTSSLRLLCQHKRTLTTLLYRVTGNPGSGLTRVEPGPGDTISEFRLMLAALSCFLLDLGGCQCYPGLHPVSN